MNESDFWLNLYNKYPNLFKIVEYGGKTVLHIITSKLKDVFPKISKSLGKKKLDNLIPLLNASETRKYVSLVTINEEEINALVRKYMNQEDWAIYLLGRKAKMEKEALNMEEVLKIKKQAINLRGQRGRILINFELQGYFDELIIPLLNYQIKELKDDSKIMHWFNNFLDKIVIFFPMAFWVKSSTTSFEIQKELIRRGVSNDFKNINIHTIGTQNRNKIENVLMKLSKDDQFPSFNYEKEDEIKALDVVTFKLKLKP